MRVAVYLGSSAGTTRHREVAVELASDLARADIGIVYGGAHVGLMGVIADTALSTGGEVVGVIPQNLVDREVAHYDISALHIVDTMHERKQRMADLADAFVALPGGAGTMEELFEAFTWGQLGLHEKPTALLNVDGFYDPLLEQLRRMVEYGYLRPSYLDNLGVVADAAELLEFISAYRHPGQKWQHDGSQS